MPDIVLENPSSVSVWQLIEGYVFYLILYLDFIVTTSNGNLYFLSVEPLKYVQTRVFLFIPSFIFGLVLKQRLDGKIMATTHGTFLRV